MDDLLKVGIPTLNVKTEVNKEVKPIEGSDIILEAARPRELSNRFAEANERAAYERAYQEFEIDGLLGGYDDLRDVTPGYVPPLVIDEYKGDRNTAEIIRNATVADDSDKAASVLEAQYKSIRRENKVRGLYEMYESGGLSYDDFLLRAYGKDIMEANGYYTDSVVYWKSEFRKGNYGKHPLDNEVLRSQFVTQAEQMFSLESFYDKITRNDTSHLESLVGQTLGEEGYRAVFGESWDVAVERLGDYETAVKYYKAGYLGELFNGLVYGEYRTDDQGNQVGVGDPLYYVDHRGKLLRVVDREDENAIDKSKEIFLYKNDDGTLDRLSFAKNGFGEFMGELGDGFVGGLLGVVDILNMAGSAAVALFQPGGFKEDYIDNFTWWEGVRNGLQFNAVKDLEGKNDADNISRGIATAIGYVAETVIEIALSVVTAGAYAAAKAGTTVAGKGTKASVKKLAKTVGREVSEKVLKEVTEEVGKKVAKETAEELSEKVTKEVIEKITKELTEEVVEDILAKSGEEGLEALVKKVTKETLETMNDVVMADVTRTTMGKALRETVMTKYGKEVIEDGTIRTFGNSVRRVVAGGGNVFFKASNNMKMLNSGTVSIFKTQAEKMFGKTWGATVARSSMNALMTTLETYTRASMLARSRGEENDQAWLNGLAAGAVAGLSTMLLSSSVEDLDNVARFQMSAMKRSNKGMNQKLITEINGKLELTRLGQQLLRKNRYYRAIGGVSELLDNVITATTRMGFSSGTTIEEGFENSIKNFGSVDVWAPALLSTHMSVFGRRGIAGKGQNEGSMNLGIVSANKDLGDIYNGLDSILLLAKQAAIGTPEYEMIDNMQQRFRQTFADQLVLAKKANPNDGAAEVHARIMTLEIIGKELTGNSDSVLNGFNGMAKTLLAGKDLSTIISQMDEQTKAMLPKDIVGNNGKISENFDFNNFVGRNITSEKAQMDLDMYKFVADMYEARTLKKKEMKKQIAKGDVKGIKGLWDFVKGKMSEMAHPIRKGMSITEHEMAKTWYTALNQAGFDTVDGLAIYLKSIGEEDPNIATRIAVEQNVTNKGLSDTFDKHIQESIPFEDYMNAKLKKDYKHVIDLLIKNGIASNEVEANQKLAEINKSPEELKKVKNHKQREMILRVQKEIDLVRTATRFSKEAEQEIALQLSKTDEFGKMTAEEQKDFIAQFIKNSKIYTYVDGGDYNGEVKQREAFENLVKFVQLMINHDPKVANRFIVITETVGTKNVNKIIALSDSEHGDFIKDEIKTTQRLKSIFMELNAIKQEKDLKNKFLNLVALVGVVGYSNRRYTTVEDALLNMREYSATDYIDLLTEMRKANLISKMDVYDLVDYDNQFDGDLDPRLADISRKIKLELLNKGSESGEIATIINTARNLSEYRKKSQNLRTEASPKRVHELFLLADQLTRTSTIDIFKDESGKELAERIGYNANILKENMDLFNQIKSQNKNFPLPQAMKELLQQKVSLKSFLPSLSLEAQIQKIRDWNKWAKIRDEDLVSIIGTFKQKFAEQKSNVMSFIRVAFDVLEGKNIGTLTKLAKEFSDKGLVILNEAITFNEDGSLNLDNLDSIKSGLELNELQLKDLIDEAATKSLSVTNKELDGIIDSISGFFVHTESLDDFQKKRVERFTKKFITENLGKFMPNDFEPYYKSASTLDEISENIIKAYNEKKIVSNLEKEIMKSFELTQKLYASTGVAPILDRGNKITINFGELQGKDVSKFVNTLLNIAKSKDGSNAPRDIETASRETPSLLYALKSLNDLHQLYKNRSIMTFDMDNENDKRSLLNILGTLGYEERDITNFQTKHIPGVYLNKDSAAVFSSGKQVYGGLDELIEKETNKMLFKINKSTSGLSKDLATLIEQVFPIGTGVDDDTILQGSYISLNYNLDTIAINQVFKGIVEASKSGKAASSSAGAYGFLREHIGFEISPKEITRLKENGFFNYVILKGITNNIIENSKQSEDNTDYYTFVTPKGNPKEYKVDPSQIPGLTKFGYDVTTNGTVRGFNVKTNEAFWKNQNGADIDLYDVIPVKRGEKIDLTRGGSTSETFYREYPDELESLTRVTVDGRRIKIPRKVQEQPITLDAGEYKGIKRVGELIDFLEGKTDLNITEEATLVLLKSAKKVSSERQIYIDKYFKDPAEAKSIKKFMKIFNDEEIVEHIAKNFNQSDEDIAKSLNKLIEQNKVEYENNVQFEAKINSKGYDDYRKNVIYATARSFQDMKADITAQDIVAFRKHLNYEPTNEFVSNYASVEFDSKNRFISLLQFDQTSNQFYIPVDNLLYLRSEDFNAVIDRSGRTLGGWISETFGDEFYKNIQKINDGYNTIYRSRSTKINPDNYRLKQSKIGQNANIEIDYKSTFNRGKAIEMAEAHRDNKIMSDERRLADQELLEMSNVDTQLETQFKPLMDAIKNGYDTQGWNFNDTEGRNLITNMNNRIVQGMFFDNVFAVEELIKGGLNIGGNKVDLGLSEDDQKLLALKIVSMANININKARQTPFIILEVDDQTKQTNIKFISSDSKDPYDLLGGYLMGRIETDNNKTYLLNIENGFSLRKPTEESNFLRVADITGFSKGTLLNDGKVTPSEFYQMIMKDVYLRGGKQKFKNQKEFNQSIRRVLFFNRTINEAKDDAINILRETFGANSKTPLDENFLKSAMDLFYRQSNEVSFGASEMTLREYAIQNTLDFNLNDSIFKKQQVPAFAKRFNSILMNGLDMNNLDTNIESTIVKMQDATRTLLEQEPKEIQQLVNSIYGKIVNGTELVAKAKFDNQETGLKVMMLVAMKYATNKKDSDFIKYFLKNLNDGYTITDMQKDRDNYVAEQGIVKVERKDLNGNVISTKSIELADRDGKIRDEVIYMDNEWAFYKFVDQDASRPLGLFEIGFTIKGEEPFFRKIKIDDKIYDSIRRNRISKGEDFPEYTQFNKWLDDNGKVDAFKDAYQTGDTMSSVIKEIATKFKALKKKHGDKLILITHNGKGKGADIDALDGATKGLFSKTLNDNNIDHVDFLNDVLRKKNVIGSEETVFNKKNLNDLGKKFGLLSETHNALDDAERLRDVMSHYKELLMTDDTARTRMLKDIDEIAKVLGINATKEEMINYLNENFKFDIELTPEEIDSLKKYVNTEKTISEEFIRAVTEQMNFIEQQRELSHQLLNQYASLETKIYNAQDTIDFMKGIDPKVVGDIKKTVNILGELYYYNKHKNIGINFDYNKFLTTMAHTIGKVYESETKGLNTFTNKITLELDSFNSDSFKRFVDDIKNNGIANVVGKFEETPDKYGYYSFEMHRDVHDINKMLNQAGENDYYKYFEQNETSMLQNYSRERIQNKVYRKFVGIINEMIIDPLADVSNINDIAGSLVNKMLRLVGADSTTHQTKEILINEIEKLNGRITTSSDFKDQLDKMFKQGFKDILTNQALYSMIKTITPEMKKRLMDNKQITDDTVGVIVMNPKAWEQLSDGIDVKTFKEANGLKEKDSIFMNILRHPSDKYDTIHGYRIVIDEGDKDTHANFYMNKHELFTKHSGDFDGDHGTFFVPNEATQKFYNNRQVQSQILEGINKPIKVLDKLLRGSYEGQAKKYVAELTTSETKQKAIYDYIKTDDTIAARLIKLDEGFEKDDGTFNTQFAKQKLYEEILLDIAEGTKLEIDDVKKNFLNDDVISGLYFINNRYLVNDNGRLKDNIFYNYLTKNQIKEQVKLASFKTLVDLKDSITGYIQKLMPTDENFGPTKTPNYIAIKLDGEDFDMLNDIFKGKNLNEAKSILRTAGMSDEVIQAYTPGLNEINGGDVWKMLNLEQAFQRSKEQFGDYVTKGATAAIGELEYNQVRNEIDNRNKMLSVYEKMVPEDYRNNYFFNGKGITYKEKRMLLDAYNSSLMKKAYDGTQATMSEGQAAKEFTKEKWIIVDGSGKHIHDENTAILNKRFADNKKNELTTIVRVHRYDERTKNDFVKRFLKPGQKPVASIGDYDLYEFKQKINSQTKLMALGTAAFGKVTLSETADFDSRFKDIQDGFGFKDDDVAVMVSAIDLQRLGEGKAESPWILKEQEYKAPDGTIYKAYKVNLGISANENPWKSFVREAKVDELSYIMNANTVEAIPVFGDMAVGLEDGKVVYNTDKLQAIYQFRQKERSKFLSSPNFMSTLIQVRGIYGISWALKNQNFFSKGQLDIINKYKGIYYQEHGNFINDLPALNELLKMIDDASGKRFSKTIRDSDIASRWFNPKLIEKAIVTTYDIYDTSALNDLKIDDDLFDAEPFKFLGRSGQKNVMDSTHNKKQVAASKVGKITELNAKGKILSTLYLSTAEALKMMMPSGESLSDDDILRFMAEGLGNYGDTTNSQLSNAFKTIDKNDLLDQQLLYDIYDAKSGLVPGWVGERLENVDGYAYGQSHVRKDNGNLYFGGEEPQAWRILRDSVLNVTDEKNPNRLNDQLMYHDPKSNDIKHKSSSNKNLLNKLLAITSNRNLTDRVLRYHEAAPKEIVAFVNSKYWSMDKDGSIKLKYHTDQPLIAENYQDYIKKIYDRLATDTFATNKEYLEKKIDDQNINAVTKEQVDAFDKSIEQEQQVTQETADKIPEYLVRDYDRKEWYSRFESKEKSAADSEVGTDYVQKENDSIRKYFSQNTDGDVETVGLKVNLLENTGLKATDEQGQRAVSAIQNLINFQHYYESEMNSVFKRIKQLTEGVAGLAMEFDTFTKLRVLELEMKEAIDSKNNYLIDHVKSEYNKLGFSEEAAANFIKNFNNNGRNQPLVALYHKTIKNIIDMSKDLGKHFGIADNFGELFLLKQHIKKGKNNNSNKASYYSTMNTLFLNQKKSLEDIIVFSGEYNFVESMFAISKNLSKMRSLLDVRDQYKESGIMNNQDIIANTTALFERELDSLEKENVSLTLQEERKILIDHLKDYGIDGRTQPTSKTFHKDLYNDIKKYQQYVIDAYKLDQNYSKYSLAELGEVYSKLDHTQIDKLYAIGTLIEAKKAMVDFMVETVNLNPSLAKKIYDTVNKTATAQGSRLTNEWLQLLPEDSRGSFSFIAGFDFATLKRNAEYFLNGDSKEQRVAYMALTGNLYMTNKTFADHLDKYFFTEKIPTETERILNIAKRGFAKFVMSMPHKLLNRMTQYSIGDIALITATDPSSIKDIIPSINELSAFYQSKGASATPELLKFMKMFGAIPDAESKQSLNLDTMERTEVAELGRGYFKFVENVFEYQTLAGRYALYKSLLKRFNDYDANPSKDKRLYGPLYSEKKLIDSMKTNEEKAREITYATIGGPNGFPLIARKQLQNWGMFLTYPLALLRTGMGHVKSTGKAMAEIASGQTNSSTMKYLLSTTGSIVGTALIVSLVNSLIAEYYDVNEETKEEWVKKQMYIDPFLSLLNDRPIPLAAGATSLIGQFREMFYEPFENADNLSDGTVNWFSANVISRLNPLIKTPMELLLRKDFFGNYGPQSNAENSLLNNLSRKTLSMFIGASGATAMVDEWKYTEAYEEDPNFVERLIHSAKAGIRGEAGNYRGYKSEIKNYFKALEMIRGYRKIENADANFTNYNDIGYNGEEMYELSYELKKALDRNQPASVVYAIINEAILDGVSSSTIKSAIFNNSITGKLSQLGDAETFYKSLDNKGIAILEDALKYEQEHYSVLKGLVKDYIEAKATGYKPKAYVQRNYLSYEPYYSYNDYRNTKSASYSINSRFNSSQYQKYAKEFMAYRQKNNFVPSLSLFTGRYAKANINRSVRANKPRKEYNRDRVKTRRYYED